MSDTARLSAAVVATAETELIPKASREWKPDWCDVCNVSQLVMPDGEHLCGIDYPDVCPSCGREASEAVGDPFLDHHPRCSIFETTR